MKNGHAGTALLVVDVQVDVVARAYKRDEVVANINDLVTRARANGIPVLWVQHHDDYLVKGTPDWQIVPELQPQAGEARIEKAYGDSFAETNLEAELEQLGVGRIVLCGAQSDACITATLYGGLYRGYSVTLVQDAHTTEDSEFGDQHYSGEQIVTWVNRGALYTRLPGVSCTLAAHDAAFSNTVLATSAG